MDCSSFSLSCETALGSAEAIDAEVADDEVLKKLAGASGSASPVWCTTISREAASVEFTAPAL